MLSIVQFGMIIFLPAVIAILSYWTNVVIGPYWMNRYDPAYPYLINGLTIVNQGIPNHWDHPGSPLQVLMAGIIWLCNIGKSFPTIIQQVLYNPEFYLQMAFFINLVLMTVMLVILTKYVYLKFPTKLIIPIIQIPILFVLCICPACLISIWPEALLMTIGSIYSLLIIKLFFDNGRFEMSNAILFGITLGMAMALKVTVLPIILIPLIFLSPRHKFLFCLIAGIFFIFLTMPIWNRYNHLFEWIWGLASHTGRYASGDKGLIDWQQYMLNWKMMFQQLWIVLLLLAGLIVRGSVHFFRKQFSREEKFLWGIAITILLQFILVAKHYALHYLLPGLLLLPALMFLLAYHFQSFCLKWKKIILIGSVVCILMMTLIVSQKNFSLQKITKEKYDQHLLIEEAFKECIILESYGVLSPSYALIFGDGWRNPLQKYGEVLTNRYSKKFNFNIWDKKIYNFQGEQILANDLLDRGKCVIFRETGSFNFKNSPHLVALVKDSRFQEVKVLVRSTEKEATALLMLGQQKMKNGNIEEAKALLLQVQALYHSGGIIE